MSLKAVTESGNTKGPFSDANQSFLIGFHFPSFTKCSPATQWVSNERRTICQEGDCADAEVDEDEDEAAISRAHNG